MRRFLPQLYTGVFFIAVFCYLWLRIDPSLHCIAHEPFFSLSADEVKERLSYPGGMADYAAVFIEQFFSTPLAGAAVVTLLLLCLSAASFALFRSAFGKMPIRTLHLFPAAFFTALHCNYHHPLSATLDYTLATAAAVLCVQKKEAALPARLLRYLIFSCVLYYFCGGAALLLFSLLVVVIAILTEKKYLFAALCVAFAAVVPFVSEEFFFLISLKDAYLHSLPSGPGYNRAFIAAAYLFLPMVFVVFPLLRGKNFLRGPVLRVISPIALLAVTAGTLLASFNRTDHISLTFCRNMREGRWQEILEDFQKTWLNNQITNHAVTEALFYAGLLPTHLFSIPQNFEDRGLFLLNDGKSESPGDDPFNFMYRCELFLKLGLVNEAQQWGYEALSVNGESAWALKRIIQTHALKKETAAALECLSILETSPLQRSWCREFRGRLLDGSCADADPLLAMISQSMPATDFIRTSIMQPGFDLEQAVEQHPVNRMAFEYCMASYLLQGNYPGIASALSRFDSLGYPALPRLYEEAIVLSKNSSYHLQPDLTGRINRQTLDDYAKFDFVLKKYQGDLKAAQSEITADFWNTYWYYCFYVLPESERRQ